MGSNRMTTTKKSIVKHNLISRMTRKSLWSAKTKKQIMPWQKRKKQLRHSQMKSVHWKRESKIWMRRVEATEQRQEENQEYKDLMAADTKAKEVLKFAKERLNQFYNPKLALTQADRVGSSVLVEVGDHEVGKAAPGPPPETWDAYAKKSEGSSSVLAMIDILIGDLDKEMTEAKLDEENGQKDYETMMSESAAKRTEDSKALSGKMEAKADAEKMLSSQTEIKKDTNKELWATIKYIDSLHLECDWLLKFFDVRKTARTGEMDALTKAKEVLSGAE